MAALGWMVLKSSHWLGTLLLKRAGYRWELRSFGDLKIGLWRKKLATRRSIDGKRRLVFIPGFGDSPFSWLGVLTAVRPVMSKEHDELVLVEFPGFLGTLSSEKPFHSMDFLVHCVSEVLDTLKPKTIVAQSLGAWLSTLYAARPDAEGKSNHSPDLLVLINPPGVFVSEQDKSEFQAIFKRVEVAGADAWRPYIFASEPRWFGLFIGQLSRFLLRPETIQFMNSFGETHFLESKLPFIKCEVRLIWGERDTLIPVRAVHLWLQKLRERELEKKPYAYLMKNIGHSPHIESPIRMTATLAQILRDRRESGLKGRWWRVIEN